VLSYYPPPSKTQSARRWSTSSNLKLPPGPQWRQTRTPSSIAMFTCSKESPKKNHLLLLPSFLNLTTTFGDHSPKWQLGFLKLSLPVKNLISLPLSISSTRTPVVKISLCPTKANAVHAGLLPPRTLWLFECAKQLRKTRGPACQPSSN